MLYGVWLLLSERVTFIKTGENTVTKPSTCDISPFKIKKLSSLLDKKIKRLSEQANLTEHMEIFIKAYILSSQ